MPQWRCIKNNKGEHYWIHCAYMHIYVPTRASCTWAESTASGKVIIHQKQVNTNGMQFDDSETSLFGIILRIAQNILCCSCEIRRRMKPTVVTLRSTIMSSSSFLSLLVRNEYLNETVKKLHVVPVVHACTCSLCARPNKWKTCKLERFQRRKKRGNITPPQRRHVCCPRRNLHATGDRDGYTRS